MRLNASGEDSAVRERPVIFSGPMVRAILDGTKTQTRRVVRKPERLEGLMLKGEEGEWCPYGAPGDRLWVRETWAVRPVESDAGDHESLARPVILYEADKTERRVHGDRRTGWGIYHGVVGRYRASIHMPRWASRLTLEITEVRVQRVQETSEEDACAEGVSCPQCNGNNWSEVGGEAVQCPHPMCGDGRALFRVLWDSLNAKRPGCSWADSPWVWCISFRRTAAGFDPNAAIHPEGAAE